MMGLPRGTCIEPERRILSGEKIPSMTLAPLETAHSVPTTLRTPGSRRWRLVALAAIVVLAAGLRFANLNALGEANHYYTAAVASMLKSWHNFFFVAAEPGGSVSVDKPPVGLWLQAISAYFLGVNGLGVLLPQILAGILSVIMLYHLVRRSFGTAAGLLAALIMAITPVVVATDRNNTMDSTLILTLLLATWAFTKATESARFRYLLLGAALVGIGFNIKMLQAFLPLPAFCALYFLGSAERLWRKVGRLALATLLLAAISLSWALIVDWTPADQRPYVGSSADNSELSLTIGYNGIQRLVGMSGGRGGFPAGGRAGGFFPQGGPGTRFGPFAGGGPRQGFGGAFSGTGSPGALRLFIAPLSKEVSWLLPLGLFSMLLLLLGSRLHWPIAPRHQALVLWGGWLLVGGVFFSIAGFFHEYYLSMLAPPLACLAAIGVVELWRLRERRRWLGTALLLAAAGLTLRFQVTTAQAFVTKIAWLPLALALFAAGAALLVASAAGGRLTGVALAGLACVVAAILVTPGIWSVLTNMHASENQSLPSAYAGRSAGPANRGGLQVDQALLDYLEPRTQDTEYLMAVPSSMQGSDYVLATGRPVLYLGGFMGTDQVATADELAQMVCQSELRYVYWDTRQGGFGARSDVSSWVASACTAVQGYETTTRNAGAPGGTARGADNSSSRQIGGFQGPGGNLQISLYDCACRATAQADSPGESTP
jgi:4-amino-4-deoxy-L-arabinose transferase-like glycosyltransferase